jgi:DNA repair protein RadC
MGKIVSRITLKQEIVPADLPSFKIMGASDVAKAMKSISDSDRERFCVLHLDARNNLNAIEEIEVGALNLSIVHPRETFKAAILNQSAAIVIGHNHPSGEVEPSDEDKSVCKEMAAAGLLLGIEVLDCVIVAGDKIHSTAAEKSKSESEKHD